MLFCCFYIPDHPHYLNESYEELYLTYQEDEADLFELLR